jgi:hypothetical protein
MSFKLITWGLFAPLAHSRHKDFKLNQGKVHFIFVFPLSKQSFDATHGPLASRFAGMGASPHPLLSHKKLFLTDMDKGRVGSRPRGFLKPFN